jgi:hypothetical protein
MASFNRYSSAVRSAIVGIEAVPGMDACGASELNEYAEQVEDVEQQIYERRRWLSDIMHDNATAIAQRQGEQINRLTLVSLIFLPVTALLRDEFQLDDQSYRQRRGFCRPRRRAAGLKRHDFDRVLQISGAYSVQLQIPVDAPATGGSR